MLLHCVMVVVCYERLSSSVVVLLGADENSNRWAEWKEVNHWVSLLKGVLCPGPFLSPSLLVVSKKWAALLNPILPFPEIIEPAN